ncbi:MAG: efflux RND transporter periplasmic adaptor subunit [Xanthomonadales bacterium]|nr:efflux RND transporter periplasmic adaptor subunit [Xanthomonadales bacterium]
MQPVRTVAVQAGRLQHQLSFHGVLEPVTRARLAFQSPGVLSTRPAAMGQYVKQGELLATLDNPELGPAQKAAAARLQEALTQRDQAERDLRRLRSLARTGAVGEEQVEQKAAELDSLQAAVARAEADLAGTRQRLEDATLLAPFDGVISMTSVEPGEFVAAGQAVMALGGLDRLEVRVLLPASLVSSLVAGERLEMRVPQLATQLLPSQVTEVSAIGERDTGLFPVTVELAVTPELPMVRPGMQAEVLVDYADVEGLLVPLSAVVDPVGGNPQVFVVAQGRVRQQPVQVLAVANDRVALAAAGLSAGERVVVAGHRSLTDGQAVRASP